MRQALLSMGFACLLASVAEAQEAPAEVPLTEADLAALTQPAAQRPDAPMSPSELSLLGLGAQPSAVDKTLQWSGFADFTLGTFVGDKSSGWRSLNVAPNHPSFYVGNINLYMSKFLTESLFTLGEIRFSYLPNGSAAFGTEEPVDTTAYDYADFGRPMRWGGIEIERFVLDWIAHPRLTVRVGQFLTPYGVWNVDHGSPTYIPPRRPWVIGVGWFPERQTGIELHGSSDVFRYGKVGYHLTLSNGTGPASEYKDLDDNKAIGGRLFYEHRQLGQLRVGASGYYGRDTSSRTVGRLDGGVLTTSELLRSQYDNMSFAADLSWRYSGWHVQSEWLVHQRAYTDAGRAWSGVGLFEGTLPSDLFGWGGYVLVGHRLPWWGIMPFLVLERDLGDLSLTRVDLWSIQPGLNIRPVDVLVIKVSYEHVIPPEGLIRTPLRLLQAQVAWAF